MTAASCLFSACFPVRTPVSLAVAVAVIVKTSDKIAKSCKQVCSTHVFLFKHHKPTGVPDSEGQEITVTSLMPSCVSGCC